jgi:hypothetical protein
MTIFQIPSTVDLNLIVGESQAIAATWILAIDKIVLSS